MKRHGKADLFVTGKLRSYAAAMKVIGKTWTNHCMYADRCVPFSQKVEGIR